jgi:hypothetical protein
MITYKDYEKQVYDWLMAKHKIDSNFTFSLRQNGSKGAELDYFIGTEKSNYFGLTFWTIPVGFPGSAADLIDVFFLQKEEGFKFFFEFSQTMTPSDAQNASALNLIRSLKEKIRNLGTFTYETTEDLKTFKYALRPPKVIYSNLEELFIDLDKTLNEIFPLVEEKIIEEKKLNQDFKAQRISLKQFDEIQEKLNKRLIKYENLNEFDHVTNESFELFIQRFREDDLKTYFDFLKEIVNRFDLKTNDERLVFNLHNSKNHLSFTVGQRYCFFIANNGNKGKFGILSKDKLFENSKQFAGNDPKPWFTYLNEFNLDKEQKQNVFDGIEIELNRTDKSSFRKFSKPEFENFVLNNSLNLKKNIKINSGIESALNQILYGPPGTGKTYNTVLEAAKIITANQYISYEEALIEFNKKLGSQIEFITFHQNYSYEDFIQGIRPDTENGKELTFEKKDGVFKRIADRALKNLTDSEKPESAKKDFDTAFQDFILPLIEEEEIEVKMKKTSFYITQISEKSIEFRKNQGDSQHTLSINTLRKMYNEGLNEIILGGLQPYYNPILKVLLEKGKRQFTPVVKKNYVIIIDEINRANISRVFGELITLIEDDKRSNGKIPLRVTLPSGDPFIVPSNLYIIGTMNTADKSIALLDIALRRRFDFVAMYPDETIVNEEFRTVFIAINKAILDRKNHDFTIGHAYFMGDNCKLKKIINNKVIPLLLEYFMNDEKEVIAILQAADIKTGGWPLKMLS